MDNMETELQMFEEGLQVNIDPDELKVTFDKIASWETSGLDGIHEKFPSIHERFATKMNKCIQKTEKQEWMTKMKITLIQKDPLLGNKKNCGK